MTTDLTTRSGSAFQDAAQQSWTYTTVLYDMRPCDDRDDFAERLENGFKAVQAAESDNSVGSSVSEPEKHNQIMDGLLFKALTRPNSAEECFSLMSLHTRDLFRHVIGTLNQLINEKLHRLQRTPLEMLLWVIGELMKNGVDGLEDTWYWLLRRCHGGDLSDPNLRLAGACLRHLEFYQDWLVAHDSVVVYAVFKFMRLVLDHADNRYSALRNTEVKFCTHWIQRRFDLLMPVGKEFIRFLLQVRSIPEFDEIWQTLLHNPRALHADFAGIETIINQRAPPAEMYQRILPLMVPFEVEQKLKFMLRRIPTSPPKILQDWFLRLHLSRPESESLRADIFRLVVVTIHPSNDVLRSEAIKRWQFLTTLLSGCTTPIHTQLCMLALFYDWLDCVEKTVFIMLTEPAMLMINYNLERNAKLSFTLLDFITRLSLEFYPPLANAMMTSVQTAFRYSLKKSVVQSLFPIFNIAHPLADARLRALMKTYFMPFIDPSLLAIEQQATPVVDTDSNSEPLPLPMSTSSTTSDFTQSLNNSADDSNDSSTSQSSVDENSIEAAANESAAGELQQKFVDDELDDLLQQPKSTNFDSGIADEQFADTNGERFATNSTVEVTPSQQSDAESSSSASYWMTDADDDLLTKSVSQNDGEQQKRSQSSTSHRASASAAAIDPLVSSVVLDNSNHFLSQELTYSLNMHTLGFTPQFGAVTADAATECIALARRISSIKRACAMNFLSSSDIPKTTSETSASIDLVVDSFCAAYQSTPYLMLCAQLAVVTQTDLALCRTMRQICAHLAREKFPAEADGEESSTMLNADVVAEDFEIESESSSSHSLSRKRSNKQRRKAQLSPEAAAAIHNVECIGTMCGEILVDRFYNELERSAREQMQTFSASAAGLPTNNTIFVQSAVLPFAITRDSMRKSVEKPWFVPMRMLFDWGTPEEDKWSDLNDDSEKNSAEATPTDASGEEDVLKLPSGPQTERILQRFLAVMNRRFPLLRVLHLYYLKYRRDRLAADDERDVTVDYENFSEECALLAGQIDSRSEFSNVSLETALYHDLAMCAATDTALFGHLLPFVCRELFAVFRNDAKMIKLIVRNCDSTQISQICYDIALSTSSSAGGGGKTGVGGRSAASEEDSDAMLLFSVVHSKPQQAFQAVIRQAFDWSPQEQTFLWDLLDAHSHISTTEISKGYLNELKFPHASQMVFLLVKRLKRDIYSTINSAAVTVLASQHRLPSDACIRLVLAERRFVGFDAVLYSIVRNWCDFKTEQATAVAEAVAQLLENLVSKFISWSANGSGSNSQSNSNSSRRNGRTTSQNSSSNGENASPNFTELENLLHNLDAVYRHYRTTATNSVSNSLPVVGGESIVAKFFANEKLTNKAALHAYRNVDAKLRQSYKNLFEFLLHSVPRHLYEDVKSNETTTRPASQTSNTIESISDDDEAEIIQITKKSDAADDLDHLSRSSSRGSTASSTSSAGGGASSFKKRTKSSAADKKPTLGLAVAPSPPAVLKQTTLTAMLKKRTDTVATASAAGNSKPKKRKKIADSDEEDIQFM